MPTEPAPTAPLSVECRSIGVRRPGVARLLSRLAAGFLVAPVVISAIEIAGQLLGVRLIGHLSRTTIDLLLSGWFMATPALALASAAAGGRGRALPGRLEVDANGVRATRKGRSWTVKPDDVVASLVVPTATGPAIDLQLTDGRALRAGVETEELAHAVLDRLGIGPDRRRVSVPLRGGNRELAAGCVAFPLAGVGGLIVLDALVPHGPLASWVLFVWLVFIAAATLAARRFAAAPEVVIGADGVLVRRASGARLLRLNEIEGVSSDGGRLVIDLRHPSGEPMGQQMVLDGTDPSLTAGLVERIRQAMLPMRREPPAAAAALLDPGEKPLAEWRKALAGLLHKGADYRRASVDVSDLLAVLEDGSAPPERRIGAALALREGDRAQARERVRLAADACVDDEVRAALEAAAEEEVDEEPIRRVVMKRR